MVRKVSRKFSVLNSENYHSPMKVKWDKNYFKCFGKFRNTSVYLGIPRYTSQGFSSFFRRFRIMVFHFSLEMRENWNRNFVIAWKTPNILLCVVSYLKRRLELSRDFVFYRHASRFIEKNLTTPKFFLVIHGGHCGNGAELKCLKLGKKFYQILKNK